MESYSKLVAKWIFSLFCKFNVCTAHMDIDHFFIWNKLQHNSDDAIIYSLKSTAFNILNVISTWIERMYFVGILSCDIFFHSVHLIKFTYETTHVAFLFTRSKANDWSNGTFIFLLLFPYTDSMLCVSFSYAYVWQYLYVVRFFRSLVIDTC